MKKEKRILWLIFPNQMFGIEEIKKIKNWKNNKYIIMEDEDAYNGPIKGMKLNKLRIIYQKTVILEYYELLKENNLDVKIIKSIKKINLKKIMEENDCFTIESYDPEEKNMKEKISKEEIIYHNSPMFLVKKEEIEEYINKNKTKRIMNSHYYSYIKKNVLPKCIKELENVKIPESKDKENIKKYTGDEKEIPEVIPEKEEKIKKTLEKAIIFCEKKYKKNPGPNISKESDAIKKYMCHIPTTPKLAIEWWEKFKKERFELFGPYEDAIVKNKPYLYHSVCSALLNIGLITPRYIINDLLKTYTFKQKKNIASLEGFIRQIAGWREYCRLYYRKYDEKEYEKNIFKNKKKLGIEWYDLEKTKKGNMPEIIKDAINDAWNTGYLHHIRRLMVVSNYMNISLIDPKEVYKWMYEFSLDSWDWVMIFNVYSMGTWGDGGIGMRKPYISSTNYIKKMSNYDVSKMEKWDIMYKNFLKKNKKILIHTIYASQIK
jgi:deoxyribodipyrimidine photolyase-related protein